MKMRKTRAGEVGEEVNDLRKRRKVQKNINVADVEEQTCCKRIRNAAKRKQKCCKRS